MSAEVDVGKSRVSVVYIDKYLLSRFCSVTNVRTEYVADKSSKPVAITCVDVSGLLEAF